MERNTEKLKGWHNKYFSILTAGPQHTAVLEVYKTNKIRTVLKYTITKADVTI